MLLEVRDLSLRFGGVRALRGLDLTLAEDETVAVIGPNGSGKTSLFNCVSGAYRPTSGAIRFRGESLLGLSPDRVARRGIARTFQNLRLFLALPVIDNLLLGRHLHFRKNLFAAAPRALRGDHRVPRPGGAPQDPRRGLPVRGAEARRARARARRRAAAAAPR